MAIKITRSETGELVTVQTADINSLEGAEEVLTTVIQACVDTPVGRLPKILFDMRRTPNHLSVVDNYRLAYEFASRLWDLRRIVIAIIRDGDDDTYVFSETLAKNIGLSVRVFTNESEALAWLEANPRT